MQTSAIKDKEEEAAIKKRAEPTKPSMPDPKMNPSHMLMVVVQQAIAVGLALLFQWADLEGLIQSVVPIDAETTKLAAVAAFMVVMGFYAAMVILGPRALTANLPQ